MKNAIGVWLDQTTTKIIEITSDKAIITTIESPYKRHIRMPGESIKKARFGPDFFYNLEYKLHHSKTHDLSSFYKDLSTRLKVYNEFVLFGPAKAKTELYNYLKQDKQFDSKTISVENKEKMSEKKMAAFIRNYFSEFPKKKVA